MNPTDEKDANELGSLIIDILVSDVKPERRQQAQDKLLQVANIGFNTCRRMFTEEILKTVTSKLN